MRTKKTKKPKFLEAAKENPRSEIHLQQQAVRVDCSKSCKQIIQFHKANQQIDQDAAAAAAAAALQTPKKKWVMTIREGTPIETTRKDNDNTDHRLRKERQRQMKKRTASKPRKKRAIYIW